MILRFDSVNVDFSSSPVFPSIDQQKTNNYFSLALVSFGAANKGSLNGKLISFNENAYTKLDSRNLMYC